jgi:transposase
MVTVETIGKVRRAYWVQKKKIKAIARELKLARNTVLSIVRSGETAPVYLRKAQPLPKLGLFVEPLDKLLEENAGKSKRERLTTKRVFEKLQQEAGYSGGYDAVRRYAQRWRQQHAAATAAAFVPLSFAPGEAYQFDWSHEIVILDGVTVEVKVAHMRLCYSRMPFVRAYLREAQEMVFDAHDTAFAFFKGACQRGIYDNMKTAVDAIYVGKDRAFNRRFLQMCSHYLVEPTACTPGAAWEKGQVEKQVDNLRAAVFMPRPRFKSLEDLNAWLLAECIAWARKQAHPEFQDQTIFEVFEAERKNLVGYRGPFDAYRSISASVSKTCLVRFDNNKILGDGQGRRPSSRYLRLCGQRRTQAGRRGRRRASALIRPQQDPIRSVALRAGVGEEARGHEERGAVQGLGAAGRARPGESQAQGHNGWRSPDGRYPHHGAHRRACCGGGGVCGGFCRWDA